VIQYDKNSYLKCPPSGSGDCSRSTCPGMKMDTTDWTNCGENVFRIYHKNGPGVIRVGDYVAFYFPAAQKWFSMYQNQGHLQIDCPGNPTMEYGFHREDSWEHCGAEIFRIHAEGKKSGQIIQNQDIIILYYPVGKQYLKLGAGIPILHSCPGIHSLYDKCPGEVFEIRLK